MMTSHEPVEFRKQIGQSFMRVELGSPIALKELTEVKDEIHIDHEYSLGD
jgi:hypothetical protein